MKLHLFLPLLLVAAASCGREDASEPAFAAPGVTLNRSRAPLGSPLEVTYRFTVQPDAPSPPADLRVFVHFLDDNDELMWTDDHVPPVPAGAWAPGQTVQYTRTLFIPIYPYIGQATIQLGLYGSDGDRVRLVGDSPGQRAYRVGTLELLPQTESVFLIYRNGWHSPEVAGDNAAIEWQWTKKEATLQCRNPKRDILFYLHLDARPEAFDTPQVVDVFVGSQKVDSFSPETREEIIRKIPVDRSLLGTGDMTEFRLVVDRTFVPSLVAALKSPDVRELGIRVFHAYVEVP